MKILVYFLILLNSLTVCSISTSRLNEFYNNIEANYESYGLFDKQLNIGDLVICKGYVEDHYSLSIYFASIISKNYFIQVSKNDHSYILSKDDNQIFYDIKINDGDTYTVSIVNKERNTVYSSYEISSIQLNQKGKGLNEFPYQTKLRNAPNSYTVIIIMASLFVVIEIIVVCIILLIRNHKKKRSQKPTNIVYESIDYQVEDDENEN